MTFLGVIFIVAGVACFLFRRSYLLPLVVIASVFEAGSIFNSNLSDFSFGVQPFYVIEIFVLLHLVLRTLGRKKLLPTKNVRVHGIVVALCVFWLWCFFSAFVMPRLFAGTLVSSPRDELHDFVPLQWTLSNLAQAGYLTLNIGTVIYALQVVRTREQADQLRRALYWAVFIVVIISFAQTFADQVGLEFPYELFNNNSGYSQGFNQAAGSMHRAASTFLEPSMAGSYLAAVTCGLLAGFFRDGRQMSRLLPIFAVLSALVLTLSTTGFVTIAIGMALLILYSRRSRRVEQPHKWSASKWILILSVIGVTVYFVLSSSDLMDAILAMTLEKMDSFSFWGRLAKEMQAIVVFVNTYGLGAGLGSNRSSGLLTTLLSSVGLVGTITFGYILYRITKLFPGVSAGRSLQVAYWSLLVITISEVVAVPDINRPVFWALFVIVMAQLNVHFDPRPSLEPVKRKVAAVRRPLMGSSGVAPAN
jgi:hypothetical protein